MNKNISELERFRTIISESKKKIKILENKISDIQSKILRHPLALDISTKLELCSNLEKEIKDAQLTLKTAEFIIWQAAYFNASYLMEFLTQLISIIEEKDYELSVSYIPKKEGKPELQEIFVVAEKTIDCGALDKIPDIIKIQEFSEHKEPLFTNEPDDKFYFNLEYPLGLYLEFPYLKEVAEVLINKRLITFNEKQAIKEVLEFYLKEFENLSKEEKSQLRKREL